jgi:hypothetical protein
LDNCARGGCSHVVALHAGRTGHCRLNGCRCVAFLLPRPTPVVAQPVQQGTKVALPAWVVAVASFIAGLVVGLAR